MKNEGANLRNYNWGNVTLGFVNLGFVNSGFVDLGIINLVIWDLPARGTKGGFGIWNLEFGISNNNPHRLIEKIYQGIPKFFQGHHQNSL